MDHHQRTLCSLDIECDNHCGRATYGFCCRQPTNYLHNRFSDLNREYAGHWHWRVECSQRPQYIINTVQQYVEPDGNVRTRWRAGELCFDVDD
jgi:hypothetical protein